MPHRDQPEFKPVYILGAGASAMLGAPLLKDFLSVAKAIRYSKDFLEGDPGQAMVRKNLKDAFDEVFKYQSSLYTTREYLGIDLDNLETLFSILDMDWQVFSTREEVINDNTTRIQPLVKTREDFVTLIVETLKRSVKSDIAYTGTIQALAANPLATFITLNYDLAIEEALQKQTKVPNLVGFAPWYALDIEPTSNARMVLKLHGSANWTYCNHCNHFTVQSGMIMPAELEAGGMRLHKAPCRETKPSLVLIPPTWYKSSEFPMIARIWKSAIEEISLATHLVIIGYSMPRTDVFFDQLLTLGLRDKRNLQRVVVINPSEKLEGVLIDVFDRHFVANRKLKFFPTKLQSLHNVLQHRIVSNQLSLSTAIGFDNFVEEFDTRRDLWEK